jgi:hypothetical protein
MDVYSLPAEPVLTRARILLAPTVCECFAVGGPLSGYAWYATPVFPVTLLFLQLCQPLAHRGGIEALGPLFETNPHDVVGDGTCGRLRS